MCLDALIGPALGIGGMLLNGQASQEQADAQGKNLANQANYNAALYQDNANAAKASNDVLSKFYDTQTGNQQVNNAALAPAINFYDPGAFQANQAGIANTAASNANSAIGSLLSGQSTAPVAHMSGTDNGQSAAALASRTATETGKSIRDADNAAKLGAYGTNLAQGGMAQHAAARSIDQTNTFARQQAQILPTDEQNAALQARRITVAPSPVTSDSAPFLSALGGALGSLGGSMSGGLGGAIKSGLSGLGSVFSGLGPSVSNPSIGPNPDFSSLFNVSGVNA